MSPEVVGFIAIHLKRDLDGFDQEAFTRPFLETLPSLKLKQHTQLIANAVHDVLPTECAHRYKILAAMLHPDAVNHTGSPSDKDGKCGWGLTPMAFILVVMLVIFLLGMFLETIAIILITPPSYYLH